jgi:hypothetical protein
VVPWKVENLHILGTESDFLQNPNSLTKEVAVIHKLLGSSYELASIIGLKSASFPSDKALVAQNIVVSNRRESADILPNLICGIKGPRIIGIPSFVKPISLDLIGLPERYRYRQSRTSLQYNTRPVGLWLTNILSRDNTMVRKSSNGLDSSSRKAVTNHVTVRNTNQVIKLVTLNIDLFINSYLYN